MKENNLDRFLLDYYNKNKDRLHSGQLSLTRSLSFYIDKRVFYAIIIMSASSDPRSRRESLQKGSHFFIGKQYKYVKAKKHILRIV